MRTFRLLAAACAILAGLAPVSPHPALACNSDGLGAADVEDMIQQGYYQDRQGDYTAAIETFRKVLASHPDSRKAHYFLAYTLWRDDDFDSAGKEFGAVLRMNPSDRLGQEAKTWLGQNGKYLKAGPQVQTVAGGPAGYADGIMSQARFNHPSGMVLSPTGNLYIADTGNHRIRRITPDGHVLTVAGNGQAGYADGSAQNARIDKPLGMALDAVGNLYFCDGTRIRFVTPDGKVGTLAGSDVKGWRDGTGAEAQFYAPKALAVDDKGRVYVSDNGTAIREIFTNGEVHLLAGNAVGGFIEGRGLDARFHNVTALKYVGGQKVLMVLDAGANRLRAVNLAGDVRSLPGCSQGGYVDGPIAYAHFRKLAGLAVDRKGNLVLADAGNFAVRRVNDELQVETLAGGGGSGTADGIGLEARFKEPTDVAVWNNTIFVLDRALNGVRRITLTSKDL